MNSPTPTLRLCVVLWTGLAAYLLIIFTFAFTYPRTFWSGLVTLSVGIFLASSLLRGVSLPVGPRRCSQLTGAAFTIAYLAIVFSGFLFSPLWGRLPTSKLISMTFVAFHGEIVEEVPTDIFAIPYPRTNSANAETDREAETPIWPYDFEFPIFNQLDREFVSFTKTGHFAFALVFMFLGAGVGYVWNGEPRNEKPTRVDKQPDGSVPFDQID